MGGFLHLFDFNQDSMARKILAHKRHVDGKYWHNFLFFSFFYAKVETFIYGFSMPV
jgi:hypothetical protein